MTTFAELDDEENGIFDDDEGCPACGYGEEGESACIDDLCHGGDVPCMHGDYSRLRCHLCGE